MLGQLEMASAAGRNQYFCGMCMVDFADYDEYLAHRDTHKSGSPSRSRTWDRAMACSAISRTSDTSSDAFRCCVICRYCHYEYPTISILMDHQDDCYQRPLPHGDH
ncbi:hypothetical protein H4R18_001830 [Coemansia javaensis]|uniref:C2H2-type domain-containing protein n=1 Tax=Coemansia javaensis TaxID=2761396 RepID=A0A9W8HEL0_9FUNG|nr:hypothetical protein H4R18_001830 [Coemansia javaensis]